MSEDLPPQGRVQITGPGPLVVLGVIGLLAGWAGRRYAVDAPWPAPSVNLLIIGVTWFIAAVTAGIAFLTRRTVVAARPTLTAQQGLARLVLGKTIDRIAAAAFGFFLGIAISQLGVASESAGETILRALIATLGGALGIAAGLYLEHACRVPPGADADLP